MAEDYTILSARRAYEFPQDSVRLTAVTTTRVQDLIQDEFSFQQVKLGPPAPIFSPVKETNPPGLVGIFGQAILQRGEFVPIRYISIDATRIVVDIAGPSAAIDEVYRRLLDLLGGVHLAGEIPIVGEPERTRDHSELSARLSGPSYAMLARSLRDVFPQSFRDADVPKGATLLPTIQIQMMLPNQEYVGLLPPNTALLVRAGTRPDDHVFVSGAYLDTESHRDYLERIDAALMAETDPASSGAQVGNSA